MQRADGLPIRLKTLSQETPGAIFCTFLRAGTAEAITFRELYSRSVLYANELRRQRIGTGDVVIIILHHSPHLLYSFMGAMLAGAIPSFMPFASSKQRREIYWGDLSVLFKRIQPRLVITDEKILSDAKKTLPQFDIPTLIADDRILLANDKSYFANLPGLTNSQEAVACLQHSSGTTNLKKGVMLTHRAILEQVATYSRAIGLQRDDVIVSWLPLYHDMGLIACFVSSLVTGNHLVLMDPFEWTMKPAILLDAIEKYRGTLCWLPNFAFSHITSGVLPESRWQLSSMRAFINCSEMCRPKTFERFLKRFGQSGVGPQTLQVCYALAENVFAVAQTDVLRAPNTAFAASETLSSGRVRLVAPSEPSTGILSCGNPLAGVDVRVEDKRGRRQPDLLIGEIVLKSSFLFRGYYRQPEETEKKIRDGWYHTGDLGFIFQGELYVTGRIDDMLVVNGLNYYAHEIEEIAGTVSGVAPGRCAAINTFVGDREMGGVVVLAECQEGVDTRSLRRRIHGEIYDRLGLTVYSVEPLALGQLAKTTSGKISRSKNKDLYLSGSLMPYRQSRPEC